MRKQGLEPLCCGSLVNQKEDSVHRSFGALELAGNVNDPPTWCGAAWTIFVWETWRPHPLWRSSLVEIGIKVTMIEFTGET